MNPVTRRLIMNVPYDGHRRQLLILALTAMVGFSSLVSASELMYDVHPVDTSFTGAIEVALADVDLDGDMDLAAVGWDGNLAAWFENDGNQQFTRHDLDSPAGPRSIVMVGPDGETLDLDGDGDGDILLAAPSSNHVVWYENDGAQNFTMQVVDAALPGAHTVVPGDLDLDGDLDLAATGDTSCWYENDGAQNFTRHDLASYSTLGCCVQVTDMDHDGDLDIFEVHEGTDVNLIWWENDGAANFTRHDVSSSYNNAHTGFAQDVDQDGDVDLVTCAYGPANICWWENDGAMGFTKITVGSGVGYPFWSEAVDLDQDGDNDILCAASARGSFWYENDGSQNFTRRSVNGSLSGAFCARPGDIDGDGDLDVVECSRAQATVNWSENVTAVSVDEGAADEGLPRPTMVRLEAAPNPFNPRTVIRYELPESCAVCLEVWDVSGRRVACLDQGERAAGGHSVVWEPRNLPSGTYSCRLTSGSRVVTRKVMLLK